MTETTDTSTSHDESPEELLLESERIRAAEGKEDLLDAAPPRSFLVLCIGPEQYAVDLAHVRMILKPEAFAKVPGAAPEILGLMNCHGEVLCVIDMRKIVKVPPEVEATPGREPLVVVLSLSGKEAGFLVDGVDDVLEVPGSAVLPVIESLDPSRSKLFEGTLSARGFFVGVLSVSICLNP